MSGEIGQPEYWPLWVQLLVAGVGIALIVWPLLKKWKGRKP